MAATSYTMRSEINTDRFKLPSQQEKIHAHSLVFGPELRVQYTYTYVKISERHWIWIRYTYLTLFTEISLIRDTNTHTWKIILVDEFEFNTNTYTSNNRQELELYIFVCARGAIRTSWITPHHLTFQELISVIISPPITPNKFWGFNKRNNQENYTTPACPY